MIDEIRLLLAALLSCIGAYLVWDLFVSGFDVVILMSSVGCFMLAHYIKPDFRANDGSSSLWDILDFIIDIPFKAISAFLRALSKPFKGDVDGIDL